MQWRNSAVKSCCHSLFMKEWLLSSRVSKGRDVPGQSGTGRPGTILVPLSLCPGTKKVSLSRCPFVPGQEQQQKSRDKVLCPGTSRGTKSPSIFPINTVFRVKINPFWSVGRSFCILFASFLVSRSVGQFFQKCLLVFFLKTAKLCKIEGHFVPRDVSKNPGPSRPVARF